MSLAKRVEMLFDPKEYAQLEEIARGRGESVAALVRRAVKSQYLETSLEQKREAALYITSQELDFGTWEDVKAAIG